MKRDSPDRSRTNVNIRVFLAFLQDRSELKKGYRFKVRCASPCQFGVIHDRGGQSQLVTYFRITPRADEISYCRSLSAAATAFQLHHCSGTLPVQRAAIRPPIASDARRSGSLSRCAYRCVVDACVCPRSLPMIGKPSPPPAPKLA